MTRSRCLSIWRATASSGLTGFQSMSSYDLVHSLSGRGPWQQS